MITRALRGLVAIWTVLLAGSVAAIADQGCLDEVARLAKHHGVSTDPAFPRRGPDTKRDLGESGGVVEPPPVRDDESVISPPAERRGSMPEVTPEKPAGKRVTLRAVLMAARAEAARGNEAGCREGLTRANKLLERGGSG